MHPPVRHHRGSGAAEEPDRVNSFLHVRYSAPVHQSNLSISGHFPSKRDYLPKDSVDKALHV